MRLTVSTIFPFPAPRLGGPHAASHMGLLTVPASRSTRLASAALGLVQLRPAYAARLAARRLIARAAGAGSLAPRGRNPAARQQAEPQ